MKLPTPFTVQTDINNVFLNGICQNLHVSIFILMGSDGERRPLYDFKQRSCIHLVHRIDLYPPEVVEEPNKPSWVVEYFKKMKGDSLMAPVQLCMLLTFVFLMVCMSL